MKKDRNSFFQSSNFNMTASNTNPMMNYNMPMLNQPMPNINGLAMDYYQESMPYKMSMPITSDLEAQLAKMQRAINRLEARINKLESNAYYTKDTYDENGNMYIV